MVRHPWVLLLLLVSACATSFDERGRFHRVQKGETLPLIAKAYRVSLQDVAELNNLEDPKAPLSQGQRIYLPERRGRPRFKKLPWDLVKVQKERRRKRSDLPEEKIVKDHGRFDWPVEGKIFSLFGIRNGRRHDGIDISAKVGTPIRAADEGEVVFSDKMQGYGNLVIVRHKEDFFTAYAHNRANKVKKGERVRRGEMLGEVGNTGRTTGPHLHFEVRQGPKARNPLFFLPPRL